MDGRCGESLKKRQDCSEHCTYCKAIIEFADALRAAPAAFAQPRGKAVK
jgi:hypothetical protein